MTSSYLFTLFFFLFLQLNFVTALVWQTLASTNWLVIFKIVIAFLIFILLYGLTQVVKAYANAKNYSYLCAVLSVVSALFACIFMLIQQKIDYLVLVCALLCGVSGLNLAYSTYKKTKSYFM